MLNLDEKFKSLFPKLDFQLKTFQKDVIANVVDKGNTLCIMQTGGGKSLIYWMSGLLCGGVTIVLSPLTALVQEQIEKLKEQGYEALTIPGDMTPLAQMKKLKEFATGNYTPQFIFLSPEKLATDGFLEACIKVRKDDVKLVVIDEIHCVSQWGISFRPFYKRIPVFINDAFGGASNIKVLGLTATLNCRERNDICNAFCIKSENIIKQELMMRSEIQLHVQEFADENQKEDKFWEIIDMHYPEKTLVYLYRKKHILRSVEGLCEEANLRGYKACAFHGDMSAQERKEIIEKFRNNEVNIVFATNAFGMGIDIPDIRVVIHFMIPESLEQYYQEVGRAARDGAAANAYLLYTNKNIQIKKRFFIDGSFPNEETLKQVYFKITDNSVGIKTTRYFDEDGEIQQCLPYYLETGLLKIECKAFEDLEKLKNVTDSNVLSFINATMTKNFTTTVKKTGKTAKEIAETVYSSLIAGTADVSKALERWLVINALDPNISEAKMAEINDIIAAKREYKYELLDYMVWILKEVEGSVYLHQEIARYLGTDKHNLNRIYKTEDGNMVRSKSEVIICNLLYKYNIPYEYEKKLYYADGKWMEPDFTITLGDGTEIYWEHVGMLGNSGYDDRWREKRKLYSQYFPNQLVYTYENGTLSAEAVKIIESKLS